VAPGVGRARVRPRAGRTRRDGLSTNTRQPRWSAAAEDAPQTAGARGPLEIGVGEHDHRVFAPELEAAGSAARRRCAIFRPCAWTR
jgi:hypothetical protein